MKIHNKTMWICSLLLLVNCKKPEETVPVSGSISISRNLIYLDSRQGSSDTFRIIAEGDWELSYPAAYKDFVFSPNKGRGNTLVTITAQKSNPDNDGIAFPFNANSGNNYAVSKVMQDAFMRDFGSLIIGTPGVDQIAQSIQTSDGGFLHVGSSSGVGSEIRQNAGKADVLLIKTDNKGAVSWAKTFGGTEDDLGYSCIETNNAFFITGESSSNNVGFEGNKGLTDLLLLKTDKSGNMIWQKKFGGSNTESGKKIRLSANNSIMVLGNSRSHDGDLPKNPNLSPRSTFRGNWLIQFDHDGKIMNQTNGLSSVETEVFDFHFVTPISVVMAGYTTAERGFSNPVLHKDFFARHLSLDTNYLDSWGMAQDGYQDEIAYACIATPDGGTITVGHSNGIIGDVGAAVPASGPQAYIIKFNAKGIVQWRREWGKYGAENIFGIQSAGPGRYILCGATSSFLNYSGGGKPNLDGYILEINEFGMVQWEESFGGNGDDIVTSVIPLGNNEYLLSGRTNSTKIQNTSKPSSGDDAWIVKLKR
jgi:hypothetical protein